MARRALCPVLVGRDETLSTLEDALLAASRGEGRLIGLGGEAGVGKTRVTTELAARATKLGFQVMWGGCSEVALQLPYLPFLESAGNWIATKGAGAVAERLGSSRRELAQLFPQLSEGEPASVGDPGQAKFRLLEAMVALFSLPARERGLLLVIEDVHWADASTREMLDHIAKRLIGERALIVATFRSDELDRRHPLRPLVQAWRRSEGSEIVSMDPLPPEGVAAMIGAILDVSDVSPEFRDLLHARSEGNPFVVEEMLKEAIDRADVFVTAGGWDRKPIEEIGIPSTVREAILLRLSRFDPEHATILEAAAILGRSFDYRTLVEVARSGEDVVLSALETATTQQLLHEDTAQLGRFLWRHALTQEAIYDEIVAPRRQLLHTRAADVLSAEEPRRGFELAHHLFGAGRFGEAVPVCLDVAEQAMTATAYNDAILLLERALPHVSAGVQRARALGLLGRALALGLQIVRSRPVLEEAIRGCEAESMIREAAACRLVLGRALWEMGDTKGSSQEFQAVRAMLSGVDPSSELANALVRLAGLAAFEFDDQECLRLANQAVEVAEAAGADFERVWALSFAGLGMIGTGRAEEGVEVIRRAAREAEDRGYVMIVGNARWNEIWLRAHLMLGDFDEALEAADRLPATGLTAIGRPGSHAYVHFAQGRVGDAVAAAEHALAVAQMHDAAKFRWRARTQLATALLAADRPEEAGAALPPLESRVDLQDIVYDAPAQIGWRLATGRIPEAVEQARLIQAAAGRLAPYAQTLVFAVRAFLAAGLVAEARAMVDSWVLSGEGPAQAWVDEAAARVALAEGEHSRAAQMFRTAALGAQARGYALVALECHAGLAQALEAAGDRDEALRVAEDVATRAAQSGAALVRREAVECARRLGKEIADQPSSPPPPEHVAPVDVGERMITSLFADIRDYTPMTAAIPPAQMADTLAMLYRWAKTEVERQNGVVDKFAGDAVMATFNVSGASVDHCLHALMAAMALRDKAALADVPVGIGIAVGPAVVGTAVPGANMTVTGTTTNLAARLQTAAQAGEIVLADEAYRRVASWLAARGIAAEPQSLALKGFKDAVQAYRIRPMNLSPDGWQPQAPALRG